MLHTNKSAFSMIELIFVIVVIGILSAIAIPKFAATRTDAQISKGRADVASVRSAIISDRQSRLITGVSSFISGINLNAGGLFGGVLTYAVVGSTADGHWASTGTDSNATAAYNYNVAGTNVPFTYTSSNGIFTCTAGTGSQAQIYCGNLIN